MRHLPLDLTATIVTHSPTIASALEPHRNVDVILIGGTVLRHSMVSVGAAALEAILRLRVDLFVLGLTGLHPSEGASTGHFEEAAIKRAIVSRAAETVSLVTAEKIGAVSPHVICPVAALTELSSWLKQTPANWASVSTSSAPDGPRRPRLPHPENPRWNSVTDFAYRDS